MRACTCMHAKILKKYQQCDCMRMCIGNLLVRYQYSQVVRSAPSAEPSDYVAQASLANAYAKSHKTSI